MSPFVEQLKRLCASYPTRAKWVIVPSHAAGRMLGDRLALEGAGWANVRFVTPLDLAVRMGAPFLVERGIDPSEEGLGPALMMRLLLDLPEDASYFRPLAGQPQMAIALWSTVQELRVAGVRARDLAAVAFSSADKRAELTALLEAYEAFLDTNARGDRATVIEEALRHPDWCPVQPSDCWTEWPGAIWSPLERQLIESLPGERISPRLTSVAGGGVSRRLHDRASVEWVDAPSPRAPMSFFQAGGPEAEVEEVFRRIMASGRALDEVEIACASDGYATLIWEKALRHDWPVTLASGVPTALTRPGRALLGLVEWIEDDFSAGLLRRLLQSGDVTLGDGRLSSGRAARLLVKARAAWGRDTYRLALGRLAASARRRAVRDDVTDDERDWLLKQAEDANDLEAWIARIIAAVPRPDDRGRVALQDVADVAASFVADHSARASALDHLAASRLTAAIRELRALGDERCTLTQALRFVRERVEGLSVGADRARPGHLFVSPLRDAATAGRPVLFVVGLEEGRVFPAAFEDPVLLDDERRAVHGDLALSSDRVDEAVFAVLSRLTEVAGNPGTTIGLSYSCRDLRQFRETYASWLMLSLYRLSTDDPSKSYRHLREHLGPPVSCVPASSDRADTIGRWWLYGVTRGDANAGRAALLRQHPMIAAGLRAEEARESERFTEFDGYVPAAGTVLDPCREDVVVSPTQLEEAAECAYRYFLRRGLKVDAIETGERDRDVWLDPLVRGSLLHELYAALLRRCRSENRATDAAIDGPWMKAEGQRTLDELSIEMPPPSAEVGERESREFLDDLKLFVENEVESAASSTPIGFEVAFGRGAEGDVEPLSDASPIVIRVGGMSIRIAGRVDRIDRLTDGTFEIVDYKTGRYWPDAWKGTFAGGRRLQHALYGLAAMELLKKITKEPTVSGAQYYFSASKGRLERKRISAQSAATVGRVLADLREVITSGLFVHTAAEADCKFCDYGAACGKSAHARAKVKLEDSVLEPCGKLAGHE